MKELEFLEIIKKMLPGNPYIGDDCALLKDLGIVVTQDSMVENIHFSLKFSTPYQLAYKAIIINLSDIFASGAIVKYVTVSLSLPKNITGNFISEFYKACNDLSKKFNFEIIGGDITGSEKIFISVCAIGITKGRRISSRKNAQVGDCVITTGVHGSSAAGLYLLREEGRENRELEIEPVSQSEMANPPTLQPSNPPLHSLIEKHLMPTLSTAFSNEISAKTDRDYAMMDTSDGLIDALFKIAQASDILISVDFNKVPYDKEIEEIADAADIDFKDWIFYGGEDYQLIACVNKENLDKIEFPYTLIGCVKEKEENHFVEVVFDDSIQKITDLEKTFNHFGNNA